MRIRNWISAYIWALLCAVGVGVQFGLGYGNITFATLAFIANITDSYIEAMRAG